jgi:hypothetical protein
MTSAADTHDTEVEVSCKEAARLMCFRRDRPLDAEEDGLLKMHLVECLNCRNFDKQLDVLAVLTKRYALGGSPASVVVGKPPLPPATDKN